jgi:hypothetical protein
MKYVPAVESGGSKAFICRIISDGFMSRKFMQLERSGPAILGVPGHQQLLQLLVLIGGVLVDLHKAVVDVAADLRGQG